MQRSRYHHLRDDHHLNCVVCGSSDGRGLGLSFHLDGEGGVEASFSCDKVFRGYSAVVHGGVISALLDGAMTNCMFANGHAAVTGELQVRFRHPVVTDHPATIRARIKSSTRPLHELTAELAQNGQVKATAQAKFLERTSVNYFGKAGR